MPDFEPRRAKPGQTFGYTTREGRQRELVADDEGVVHPDTAEDVAALDTFDLPVARKVLAEERAAEDAAEDDKPASRRRGGGD